MLLENLTTAVGAPTILIASVVILVLMLAACVCFKDKANHLQVSPLRFSFPSTLSQEIITTPNQNGNETSLPTADQNIDDENNRHKVPSLQRKLPEIPVNPVVAGNEESIGVATALARNPDTTCELYATVESSTKESKSKSRKDETDALEVQHSHAAAAPRRAPLAVLGETVPELLRSNEGAASSGDSDGDNPYAQVHHRYDKVKKENPYALVKGQTSEERDTDTDNYDDPQIYSQAIAQSGTWNFNENIYEPAPPVPCKHFDLGDGECSVSNRSPPSSSQLTAANAMTGRVSASEIPYLTSPIESPLHQPSVDQRPRSHPPPAEVDLVYNVSQDSANGQDIRYTSISVREPLANLRSVLPQQESYYTVVSDDDLYQTYDEIREQISSNSVDSALESRNNANRELPPVPPPVESLRSLANNNLRPNSSSSTLSGHAVGSSSDAGAQHLSPYGSNGMVSSPSPVSDTSDLYSTVNKPKNSNRRTIHVTEQQSIEEMYAKVLKNKHLSLRSDDALGTLNLSECKPKLPSHPPSVPLPDLPSSKELNSRRPKSMVSYLEQPEKQDRTSQSCTNSALDLSKSVDNDLNPQLQINNNPVENSNDPGYESIRELLEKPGTSTKSIEDPGYETIRRKNDNDEMDDVNSSSDFQLESYNVYPDYETVVEARNNDGNVGGNAFAIEPNYETVHHRALFGSDNDPGYEEIGKQRGLDDESECEAGYECIKKKNASAEEADSDSGSAFEEEGSEQEPGYERIRKASVHSPVPSYDPGYETVRLNKCDNLNGYEGCSPTFDGEDDLSDPSYERVNFGFNQSDTGSSNRAQDSWDLSPRLSDSLSDNLSFVEDESRSLNDVAASKVASPDCNTNIIENSEERGNTGNIEPPYAVVRKKNKKPT